MPLFSDKRILADCGKEMTENFFLRETLVESLVTIISQHSNCLGDEGFGLLAREMGYSVGR